MMQLHKKKLKITTKKMKDNSFKVSDEFMN